MIFNHLYFRLILYNSYRTLEPLFFFYQQIKMDKLRLQFADLQNQEEPAPPDVSQLEEDVKQQEVFLKEAESNVSNFILFLQIGYAFSCTGDCSQI